MCVKWRKILNTSKISVVVWCNLNVASKQTKHTLSIILEKEDPFKDFLVGISLYVPYSFELHLRYFCHLKCSYYFNFNRSNLFLISLY